MAIQHKFLQNDFGSGFQTNNAILDLTPYKPEIMFIGTFNPNTPNANFADFFYGRNFFWPAIQNLFIPNTVNLGRRMPPRGQPKPILKPTLTEIFALCCKLKLTFSDLISEVLFNNNPQYKLLQNDNIIFNDQEYNLIQDEKKKSKNIKGLKQLDEIGQVKWNTNNIINYLCDNPQIKSIYFTRKPTEIWGKYWNLIGESSCMEGRLLTNIFTPSAAGAPVNHSMKRLLHHWVHNSDEKFGALDNKWLIKNGVALDNFKIKMI